MRGVSCRAPFKRVKLSFRLQLVLFVLIPLFVGSLGVASAQEEATGMGGQQFQYRLGSGTKRPS